MLEQRQTKHIPKNKGLPYSSDLSPLNYFADEQLKNRMKHSRCETMASLKDAQSTCGQKFHQK